MPGASRSWSASPKAKETSKSGSDLRTHTTGVGRYRSRASQVAPWVSICLPVQETQETGFWSLGQEDPLEKEKTTHSSTVAWDITGTEEPGRLQPMGSQRAGRN